MARLTVIECDSCGTRIEDKPWKVRLTQPGRNTAYVGDLCDSCATSDNMFRNFRIEKRDTNGRTRQPQDEASGDAVGDSPV